MTRRDEVIRMAKLAAQGEPISGKLCCELIAKAWTPFFERFAAMVAADEREQCAQACDERGNRMRADAGHPNGDRDEFYCADDIRALKDGEE